MKALFLSVLLLAATPHRTAAVEVSQASESTSSSWTTADTALRLTSTALLVADWLQSRTVATGNWRELNPILGPHPSLLQVNGYFLACIATNTAVAYLLPHPWREIWQSAWLSVEGATVGRNFSLNIGFRF